MNEDMNHAVDFVVRDVARAAGAAVDPHDGDSELAPVSSWYFRALRASVRARTRAAKDSSRRLALRKNSG